MRTPLVLIMTWRIGRALHGVEDGEEIRVDGRLAAGELDEIGLALACDQCVQHALDLGERPVAAVDVGRIGKADRASEVAGFVDLDDREAAVLLVVGAQPAIERAAGFGAGLAF